MVQRIKKPTCWKNDVPKMFEHKVEPLDTLNHLVEKNVVTGVYQLGPSFCFELEPNVGATMIASEEVQA
jgi:hypothetical protein